MVDLIFRINYKSRSYLPTNQFVMENTLENLAIFSIYQIKTKYS